MSEVRISQLKELLHFSRPVAEVVSDLSVLGWDSDTELVALESSHISAVLRRFLSGSISVTDVEDWANAIECREDIGLVQESAAAEALHMLANPLLTRPLTGQSALEWVATLDGVAT